MAEVTFTSEEIATFPQGPRGDRGSWWFVDSGVPLDSFGGDCDLYLDRETGDVYRKENGTWV